jgi:hypothetical protein
MTWNGATRVAYVDGVRVGGLDIATQIGNTPSTSLSIGDRAGAPSSPFPGTIDDFMLFKRVLSQTELTQLATPSGP